MTLKRKIYEILLLCEKDGGNIDGFSSSKAYYRCLRLYGKDRYKNTFKAKRRWENGGKNVFYKHLAIYIVASGQALNVIDSFKEGYRNIYIH